MKHVLLVDDDPAFRSWATMLLSQCGYRVSQACDGSDALQAIEKFAGQDDRIDLLFTDLAMERMSGRELIETVLVLGLRLPVLVATGFLDEASLGALRKIENYRFLVKPFKPQDMFHYLAELTAD